MEPQIQYAKTRDGVSIAYWTLGQGGTPLVIFPPLEWGHLTLEWQIPALRAWFEHMAARRMIVRYDARCYGLSDRDVEDISLAGQALDIDAVAERLDLTTFDLFGIGGWSTAVVWTTARRQDRAQRLVLLTPFVRLAPHWSSERMQTLRSLAEQDWELFCENWARTVIGWSRGEEAQAHQFAAFIRMSRSQQDTLRFLDGVEMYDVGSLLPGVTSPTLILHLQGSPQDALERAREFASRMPNARLAQVPWEPPWWQDQRVVEAIDEFLEEGRVVSKARASALARARNAAPAGTAPPEAGMAVILFADIADSTALTEHFGDAAFRDRARELDSALREIIGGRSGTPIDGKLLGDGVLATFASAKDAIECSMECARSGNDADLPLHLGLHAGDVIREENNVFGGAVNIASRIADASAPGEVLVSQTVRDLARTSAGVSFEDRGEHDLKGVSEPVRVFAVGEAAS